MVGVGPEPDEESALARVSFVNFNGEQVYDSDWRTAISGITRHKMREARSLEQVQLDASKILEGRILVGHAVRNDLEAVLLSHPRSDIRDTARHPPFRRLAGGGSPRLKILASEILGIEIQNGAHSSVEDARVTMLLFQREKDAFEREAARKTSSRRTRAEARPAKKRKKRNKKR
jgi:RNA exonuclease 4